MTNSKTTRLKIIRPVRSGQTTEQVVARIYDLIKRDDLKPGERLPAERELSKQLGISRPSLRAGLSSLIAIGVLQSRQGAGTLGSGSPTSRRPPKCWGTSPQRCAGLKSVPAALVSVGERLPNTNDARIFTV